MSTFYYLTEAGGAFGLGHVKRYEAICQILPEFEIELVINEDSDLPGNYRVWSNEHLSTVRSYVESADAIFLDTFVASETVFKEIEQAKKLVIIDDFLRRRWTTGLIIDWTLDVEKWREETGEKALFGIKYLVTRSAFNTNQWASRRNLAGKFDWIIGTIFGGADNLDLTSSIYSTLLNNSSVRHFGTSNYPSYPSYKGDERFYWNLPEQELASRLCECDVVVTAGGQMLYELASMGVPSICVSTIDNQDEDFERFVANKLTEAASVDELKSGQIIDRLRALNQHDLKKMNQRCRELFEQVTLLADEIRSYLCI